MRKFVFFWLLLLSTGLVSAQSMIQLRGIVFDADSNVVLDSVTIIVKHSSRIMKNRADGGFSVFVKPTDTLIFALYGYRIKYLCFKDSTTNRDFLNLKVGLQHLKENLDEVVINKARTQREVRKDIQHLAYNYARAMQQADAVQSPVTALYNQYNHKAQAKTLLKEYEFLLAKNKLVLQLLDIYNRQGIIDMSADDRKKFTDDLNLDWDFLIATSDYDLAVFIKEKALAWKK